MSAARLADAIEPVRWRPPHTPRDRPAPQAAQTPSPEPQARRGRSRQRAVYPPVAMRLPPPPPPRVGLGLAGIADLPGSEPRNSESRAHFNEHVAIHQNPRPAQRRRLEDDRAPGPQAAWGRQPAAGPERDHALARGGWSPEALRIAFADDNFFSEEYVSVSPQVERERHEEAMEMRARRDAEIALGLTLDQREQAARLLHRIQPYRPWETQGEREGEGDSASR